MYHKPPADFCPAFSPVGDSHSNMNTAAPVACKLKKRMKHQEAKSYGSVKYNNKLVTF